MKRLFILLLTLAITQAKVSAGPNASFVETAANSSPTELASLYNSGNAAYRDGDFDTAINLYTRIAEEARVFNSDLFYNLANAHMKKGDVGKSVLYYRRALLLSPRDSDIIANLDYARSVREDRIDQENEPVALGIISSLSPALTLNEHALITLLLFTAFSILLFVIAVLKFKKQLQTISLKKLSLLIGFLFVVESLILAAKTGSSLNLKDAVIISESVSALSSPSVGSEKLFELHEGSEILVLRNENDFLEISLTTGWKGWVPQRSLEFI